MTIFTSLPDFTAWVHDRLAEMDAGLAAMEADQHTRTAAAGGRTATAEARLWRDAFARRVELTLERDNAAALVEMRAVLQEAWIRFETEMENWAVAAEEKSSAFDARAQALLGVWHAAAAAYRTQALTAAGESRRTIDAAIAKLERDAAVFGARIEDLKDVGHLSWVAMGQVLNDSRSAFEHANATARAAFATAKTKM